MQIQFGSKQLKNPTPTNVGNFIQVYTVIAAIILAWIGTANFIPTNTGSIIQSILGLTIGIANGVKPFFGIETNKTRVDIDKVSEMETPQN